MSIAITGIGLTVPGANSIRELCDLLTMGQVATKLVDIPEWGTVPAGICDCPPVRPHKVRQRGTRAGELACYAGAQAMAGDIPDAIICGISEHGGTYTQRECHDYLLDHHDLSKFPPIYLQHIISNAPAGELAQFLGCHGTVRAVSTACASGLSAIIEGCEMLIAGRADVVLAGGTGESPSSYGGFAGFAALGALAKDQCRPFSRDRDGIVISEGACFVRLERPDTSRPILAYILDWAETCDATHPTTATAPYLAAAFHQATNEILIAGTIAHATGTPTGDEIELSQIPGPLTSIKGAVGHTMGAAGAVNAAVAATGLLPPCLGDPISDRVITEPIQTSRPIATTALGMWGQNAVMVVQCATK